MSHNVGALWDSKYNKDTVAFTGNISLGVMGQVEVVVFHNRNKKGEQPDYHIVMREKQEPKEKKEEEEPF
jgi:hypothetical protein